MMKQILLLSLILVLSQQQTDFSFTPGNMWYIKYGNAQAADGTNANNFEEGYKDNLPVDETYGDVSWYTFLKNWGSDKTKCAEITGDGTAASAYALDGTATTWQLTTPDTDTTKDVEYDTLISSDNSFCLRMTQEYNTFSAFALRPIPLDAIKCYEDTKDFSPLSDAGNNYKGCFATAIKPIADKWVWLESKFKFQHDNFDVATIDPVTYIEEGSPFRVGTVGGYVQCVKRNECYSKLSDHMTSRSNYPENDIWWWKYHASIVAKFTEEPCNSLNLGSDPKKSMDDFRSDLQKCLNGFKKDLLATDREAAECLLQCAEPATLLPESHFKVGPIDGEASDSVQEYQTQKKTIIESFITCVNNKNLYTTEIHPNVVTKQADDANYDSNDVAVQNFNLLSSSFGWSNMANQASEDQQVRVCFKINNECTQLQYWLQYGYQSDDYMEQIFKCISECSNEDMPFQFSPTYAADQQSTLFAPQRTHLKKQQEEVRKCYNQHRRQWEVMLYNHYDD